MKCWIGICGRCNVGAGRVCMDGPESTLNQPAGCLSSIDLFKKYLYHQHRYPLKSILVAIQASGGPIDLKGGRRVF